ncbi:hypothetical protein M409DRAFT_57181 [Zasmidium cellare ATCC 36951]|uniref:Protein kinase domain-containing protein n=1 Tax=Zasmidium cellare ATCC 36951 TaxID=1080233 RepID=A0A6A6C9G6_ZASCE|nr:uncharacterized protein M409DRAFT_57181 [Zasmidium cellare ATCC 36951]KAF2163681.1 hypothetical protein M409DRAFT_57181 [Zasmidium cellare ATCC 36951]
MGAAPSQAPKPKSNNTHSNEIPKQLSQRSKTASESSDEQGRFENESEEVVLKELGSGSYAVIFATIDYDRAIGDPVEQKDIIDKMQASISATKVLRNTLNDEEGYRAQFQAEIRMLWYLNDNYLEKAGQHGVVRILHPRVGSSPGSWFSMEMYTGGTLEELRNLYWKDPPLLGATIPEGFLWHILAELTETLLALNFGIINGQESHDQDIMAHYDLHGGNVMLRWPGKTYGNYPDVIITDFGLGIAMDSDMADKERAEMMYQIQIRDLNHIMEFLWTLMCKSDDNSETLLRVFNALYGVGKSPENKRMKRRLEIVLKEAKVRRENMYKELPDAWIQYLSRPTVSDKELETFLQQSRWT